MIWQAGRFQLDLTRPRVMAIVNLTPDSFSDGGLFISPSDALRRCELALEQGADILDLGAESTRPGAQSVSEQEELDRLMPVVECAVALGVPLSVDTAKPRVMDEVLRCGADIINDVQALQLPGAVDCIAAHRGTGVVIMHMQGEPRTMQADPQYADVLSEVTAFLAERLACLDSSGIAPNQVVVDPGIGFGKSPAHNIELAQSLDSLNVLARPILVGWSRKSTLGWITGREVHQRVVSSVLASVLAASRGAKILRVHDVAQTVDGLKVASALGALPSPLPAQ